MESLTISILEACKLSNLGRTFIYERINDGSLKAVKAGKKTLVVYASLKDYLANLPTLSAMNRSTAPLKLKGIQHGRSR